MRHPDRSTAPAPQDTIWDILPPEDDAPPQARAADGDGRDVFIGDVYATPLGDGLTLADIADAAIGGQADIADLFVRRWDGERLYDHAAEGWMLWRGHGWDLDAKGDWQDTGFRVLREKFAMAAKLAQDYGRKSRDKSIQDQLATVEKIIRSAWADMGRQGFRANVARLACSGADNPLADDGQGWDTAPFLLRCRNGILDLRSGRMRDGEPEDRLLHAVDMDFDADAEAPRWERFLREIFAEDPDVPAFLQRLIGYAACRDGREHRAVFLVGSGANGKSVLLGALQDVLGGFAPSIPPEMLLAGNYRGSSGPSPDLMTLRGAALAVAAELPKGGKLDARLLKSLTGGDNITARPLYGSMISFRARHTPMISTNFLPAADATDEGLWRRILVVNFKFSFKGEPSPDNPRERPIDRGLSGALRRERQGILAWIARGAAEWYRRAVTDGGDGLDVPEACRMATEAYREQTDILADWLADCTEARQGAWESSDALFQSYTKWAEDARERRQLSKRTLIMALKERGFTEARYGKSRTRGLAGLCLVTR